VVIPSCGHVPMVEQPAKVMQALLAFLDPQPGPR
jgi:pimeloyl-ACP methyl ester carboxylesterase